MPENTMPELAPEMLSQQVPAARVGGLIRKFDNGGQFDYNPYFQEALAQTFQMNAQELIAAGADPSQVQRAGREYAQRLQETPESIASVYNPLMKIDPTAFVATGRIPEDPQQVLDAYHQEQARKGLETDPYFGGAQFRDLAMEGVKISSPEDLQRRFFPAGVEPTEFVQPLPEPADLASTEPAAVDTQVDNGATTGDGGRQRAQGSNLPRDGVPAAGPDDNLRPAASNNQIPAYTPWNQNLEQAGVGSQARNQISFLENQQVIHDLIGRTASRPVDPRSTELRTELSNFESEESNRIRELGDEIDQYMLDLDDLEGEIPDRESIKKRIKTQTKLGLAQAFFNAAEKGSPDFITAMAGAFGDASGVMNKMTGQEQKEIYQHAVDSFNRKATRANAAFTRRQGLLTEQSRRATTAATTRANYLAADRLTHEKYMNVLEYNHNVWKEQNQLNLSEQDREKALQDYYATTEETYNEHWRALAQNPITGDPVSGREQNMRQIGLPYAKMGSPSAMTQVNLALEENLAQVHALYKEAIKDPSIQDPLGNAWNAHFATLEKEGEARLGDLTILKQLQPDLYAVTQNAIGQDGQIDLGLLERNQRALKEKYPWMQL